GPICFVSAVGPALRRTRSTPRARHDLASSHLDPSRRPGNQLCREAVRADFALLVVNLVYATSYVAARLTLDAVPPASLALLRCVIGTTVLWPLARRSPALSSITSGDHVRIAAMGILGFGAAFALGHWGLLRSTAANAAL